VSFYRAKLEGRVIKIEKCLYFKPDRAEPGSDGMPASTDQQNIYVAIWAKTVETQMHFNEMSVKSRQFGLAFVAAALGLGIVLFTRSEDFSIPVPILGGFSINIAVIIAFAAAVALYAVKLLDLNVYHKMLRGAVVFGEDFEQKYMREIFDLEKGMTQAISHFSRIEDAKAIPGKDGRYRYEGNKAGTALEKIQKFYRFSIGALCVVGIALFFATAHFGQLSLSKSTSTKNADQIKAPEPPQQTPPAQIAPSEPPPKGSKPEQSPGKPPSELPKAPPNG
jgi:hypothetical protein